MKKLLFSIVALVAFGTANAQIKPKGSIEITPKIGTSSFSEYNDDGSTDSNSGVELGATIDYYFNNRWSLRSGLVFDKMGGEYKLTNTDYDPASPFTTNHFEDKLNYMSIPVNANWHFGSTRKWNLNFGLSPSFLTKATVVENGFSNKIPNNTIETFQLGMSFGIGHKIGITEKFGVLIDAQWFNGLTNINKANQNDITNGGFSFNLGGVIQL
jgi:outer membrane receptor for monomeric catechols